MYRTWQPLNAPSWLQGPNGGAWQAEFGGAKDEVLDRARLGVLARFPGKMLRELGQAEVEAPSDALDHIGADRGTPRAPGESDAVYAARLLIVWDTFTYLGGPYGMLRALADYGYANVNIIQDNGRYWFLSAGVLTSGTLMSMATRGRPGWQFDLRNDLWTRFGLLFTADAANVSGVQGQTVLNALVERWRPAGSSYLGAWVILAGRVWGWPTTKVWGSGNWGGGSSRWIPPDGNPAIVTGP